MKVCIYESLTKIHACTRVYFVDEDSTRGLSTVKESTRGLIKVEESIHACL